VLLVEMCNLPPWPVIAPDTSDAAHEALLRRSLDCSRHEKGSDHEETLAHVTALAVHLDKMGKTKEARSLREEHDRIDAQKSQERKALEMRGEPVERRAAALQAYRTGDYTHAECLLRSLITEGFEVPSARCHLSRLLLIQDRFEEATTETCAAWRDRVAVPSYVVPRILWLQLALLFNSPTTEADIDSPPEILGRLKTAFSRESAHMEWTMDPVLQHLQPRLPPERHQLLAALVAALNDTTNLPALEQFSAWRDAQPQPLE